MKKINKNFVLIIILFAISATISWGAYFKIYRQNDNVNIHVFPKKYSGWTSEEMTITKDEYELLETKNAFTRKYISDNGTKVYLFIVYSDSNRKVSHPPEICYTGAGVSVTSKVDDLVYVNNQEIKLNTNRLLLEKGDTQQMAYYWFKVGDDFTASYWMQQWKFLSHALTGRKTNSALIRVSAPVHDGDLKRAEKELKEFIQIIYADLTKHLG